MAIIFRPTGTLDVSTDPSILAEDSDGRTISSGAMQRCKNLRLDDPGVMKCRHGSSQLGTTSANYDITHIVEQGGVRYTFAGREIYRNETLLTGGVQCSTPEFNPAAGQYAADQSVEITCDSPRGAKIYYTINGNDPTEADTLYESAVTVPTFSTLKAVAMRSGFDDSEIASGYYGSTAVDLNTEGGDDLVTETDADDLIGEG